jgi:hypothetical protein
MSTIAGPVPQFHSRQKESLQAWPEWLTLAGYAALLAFAIPYHEPWADEAQAWQLARSVPLRDLFRHYLRYEGSPGLWHLLLALLARLHVSYTGMHWVAGAIACAGIALLVFCAPFPRSIRLVLPFTFFLAFQYAVVARSYVLVPSLLFAIAALWRRNPIAVAVLLGLLGNVALHALAISGGMALLYLLVRCNHVARRTLLLCTLLLAAFYAFALWTVAPKPADLAFESWPAAARSWQFKLLAFSLRSIASILTPIIQPVLLAIPLWYLFIRRFVTARRTVYLLPILTFALFGGYYATFWHSGLVIPTAIAVCWITWEPIAPRRLGTATTVTGYCVLALQVAWTVHAVAFDHDQAYSGDQQAAAFLAPYAARHQTMAVTYFQHKELNAFHSIGLAPYFDHPIFLNQPRPFWFWQNQENTPAQFQAAMLRHPVIIDAMLFQVQGIDPPRDPSDLPLTSQLRAQDYTLTHTFCGEKPEGFRQRERICHVIFQQAAQP